MEKNKHERVWFISDAIVLAIFAVIVCLSYGAKDGLLFRSFIEAVIVLVLLFKMIEGRTTGAFIFFRSQLVSSLIWFVLTVGVCACLGFIFGW